MQSSSSKGEDAVAVERVTAVGASKFGRPVWSPVYNYFVHAADHAAWVHDRLTQANFHPIGVPEGSSALSFVQDVLARNEWLWQSYAIPVAQRDNALARLALLHMPMRCIIKCEGGDEDDVEEEVSFTITSSGFGDVEY